MTSLQDVIVVGAGLAAARAVETLRAEGFDGGVTVVGEEPDAPYERPPLSKSLLRGESPFSEALALPAEWYAEHEVELLCGARAVALDAHARSVVLEGGPELRAGAILLATGAAPRRLPVAGGDLDGVLTLRTRADADALGARLRSGGPVAVIGAGWIGCEVAASARTMGRPVTLLEAGATPLERVLGAELGARIAALHREHGVDVRCGVGVDRLEDDGAGAVAGVRLADGGRVEATTVVVGVGVAPRSELAEGAGLAVSGGIEVDARLRTKAPGVLAAGDVARALRPRYGRAVRVEHWANANEQGTLAARSLLGLPARDEDDPLPYFFSDQYDSGLEYFGRHDVSDTLLLRPAEGSMTALWLDGGDRVTAALHIDDWDASDALRALVGTVIDRERAADPAADLGALAPA